MQRSENWGDVLHSPGLSEASNSRTYGETCEDSVSVVEPTEDKHMDEFS